MNALPIFHVDQHPRGASGGMGVSNRVLDVQRPAESQGSLVITQLVQHEHPVRALLRQGRVAEARKLAERHTELPTSLKRALARPTAVAKSEAPSQSHDLRSAVGLAQEYEGEWVALRDRAVLYHHDDPRTLSEFLRDSDAGEDVLVIRVPRGD